MIVLLVGCADEEDWAAVAAPSPPEPPPDPSAAWAGVPDALTSDPSAVWPLGRVCGVEAGAVVVDVGDEVSVGSWSGREVDVEELGIPTRLVLASGPDGSLWKIAQDGWRASRPDSPPLRFLPAEPSLDSAFESGPRGTASAATSRVVELGPHGTGDSCAAVERLGDYGDHELWWWCVGLGPVEVVRGAGILALQPCP